MEPKKTATTPMWWWSQLEDGQPGGPIKKQVTADEIWWVMQLVPYGPFVVLHGSGAGELKCCTRKTRQAEPEWR